MAADYRVAVSDKIRADVLQILSEAESYGSSREVEAAMLSLETRMSTDPSRFGDPAYRHPSGKGMVFRDMQDVACAYFLIDEEERVVRVTAIRRVSFPGE